MRFLVCRLLPERPLEQNFPLRKISLNPNLIEACQTPKTFHFPPGLFRVDSDGCTVAEGWLEQEAERFSQL